MAMLIHKNESKKQPKRMPEFIFHTNVLNEKNF